ncbi:hypothetical protein CPB83DRAFT_849896 [Crepidotus variabilis]|uniref:Rhodopsin domain-containing protein n=1 Tax=Crepidotus variabilis TaxID=179855 RepID=A0A9P6ELS9_9AGAR|nr:hypothetical protein CPB83DRAFT_849896 [Crepidotus variabilis]
MDGSMPKGLFKQMKIWAACLIAPEALVVVLTFFRLVHRYRTRMLWWDDYATMLGLLFALPFFGTTWFVLISRHWTRSIQIPTGWVTMVSFMSGLWATRVSLTLSIARVISPNVILFRILIFVAICFTVLGTASVAQLAILCVIQTEWQNRPPFMCPPSPGGSIFPYTASLVSDITLVLIPILLFRNVKLPPAAKRLVLVGFAASAFLAPVVIMNLVFGLIPFGQQRVGIVLRSMLMHLSALISFLACNALVVMTYFYRRRNKDNAAFLSELHSLSTAPPQGVPRSRVSDLMSHLSLEETKSTPGSTASPTVPTGASSLILTDVSLHSSDYSFEPPKDDSLQDVAECGESIFEHGVTTQLRNEYVPCGSSNAQYLFQ